MESEPQMVGVVCKEPVLTIMKVLGGRVYSFPLSFSVVDSVLVARGMKTAAVKMHSFIL